MPFGFYAVSCPIWPGSSPEDLLPGLKEHPGFVGVVHRVAHLHPDEDGVEDHDHCEDDVEPGVGHELVDATYSNRS